MPNNVILFRQPIHAPAYLGAIASGFGRVWYVSEGTNPAEDAGPVAAQQGTTPRNPFVTIASAVSAATAGRGDVIVIQRGTYTENVAFSVAGLTVIGAPGYGYPDHVVIQGRTTVTASNVSFYNLEFFSNSATSPSVDVNAFSTAAANVVNSAWFENCSFASNGTIEPLAGVRLFGGNDHTFKECFFIDNGGGIAARNGTSGTAILTGLTVVGCEFLENTTYDIGNTVLGTETQGLNGEVDNLVINDNYFGGGEVLPTRFLDFLGVGNGVISNCHFARATNVASAIRIALNMRYVTNGTEAGITAARPS